MVIDSRDAELRPELRECTIQRRNRDSLAQFFEQLQLGDRPFAMNDLIGITCELRIRRSWPRLRRLTWIALSYQSIKIREDRCRHHEPIVFIEQVGLVSRLVAEQSHH